MVGFTFRATIQNELWTYLDGISAFQLVPTAGGFRLYAGSGSYGGVIGFDLSAGVAASHIGSWAVNDGSGFRLSDLTLLDQGGGVYSLLTSELGSNQIESYNFNTSGDLVAPNTLQYSGISPVMAPQITSFTIGTTQFVATGGGAGRQAGINIYEVQNDGTLAHRDAVLDHIKVTVGDIADLLTVEVNGSTFLVAGSTKDGGISTFSVDADGKAHLVDAIGIKEGLWLSGLDALTATEAGGTSYIIIGATSSSSLSVVRINPMGVLYVTDHIIDSQTTRFSNVDAIDSFTVSGRGFVIAGGSDDGLSLFEIMPDGQLLVHDSIENQVGWTLENITALKAVVIGNEVQVFASGGRTPGIMQFTIPADTLAAPLTGNAEADSLNGTAQDDLIYGGSGNDTLYGYAGDDILFGGDGADVLYGGAGADIFIIDGGGDLDQIGDFVLGSDRIDLSRWGMIYDPASLTILSHSDGALLSFNGHSLRIYTDDSSRLTAADLTIDSFIF